MAALSIGVATGAAPQSPHSSSCAPWVGSRRSTASGTNHCYPQRSVSSRAPCDHDRMRPDDHGGASLRGCGQMRWCRWLSLRNRGHHRCETRCAHASRLGPGGVDDLGRGDLLTLAVVMRMRGAWLARDRARCRSETSSRLAMRALGTPSATSRLMSAQSSTVITPPCSGVHFSPAKSFSFRTASTAAEGWPCPSRLTPAPGAGGRG